MRFDTAELRIGDEAGYTGSYRDWTRSLSLWFHRATPWLAILVTLGCGGGVTLGNRSASLESLPVTAVTGREAGPTVAFVAGVHGGKVAAVRAVEQLRRELPGSLTRGRVLLLAPANAAGFEAELAQTSPADSLNLNRVFPGKPDGRPTERLAAAIMSQIVAESDYLVDMHGSDGDEAVGSFAYAARPGVSPPVDNSAYLLARAWGVPVIVRDEEGPRQLAESRFLQTAAHLSDVPAITVFESGSTRKDSAATAAFVRGAKATLAYLGMLAPPPAGSGSGAAAGALVGVRPGAERPDAYPEERRDSLRVFTRRVVTTAPAAGSWVPAVAPGQTVAAGELLGEFTSSTGEKVPLRSGEAGFVLHQRKAGAVAALTPLIIAGTSVPRSAPPTRP